MEFLFYLAPYPTYLGYHMRIPPFVFLFSMCALAFPNICIGQDTPHVTPDRDTFISATSADLERAHVQLQEVLKAIKTEKPNRALGDCFLKLARLYHRRGSLWEALGRYNQSDSVYTALRDSNQLATVYSNRSAIYMELEQFDLALTDLLSATEMIKNGNDSLNIARKQFNLGNLYMKMKLYDQALYEYENVLGLFNRHGTKDNQANVMGNIGGILVYKAQYDQAYELFQKGLKIRQKIESPRGLLYSNSHLGFLFENQNLLDSAFYRYSRSYYWATLAEDQLSRAKALGSLAIVSHKKEEYDKSVTYSERQISLLSELNDSIELKEVYRRLAETYKEQGNLVEALDAMVLYDNLQRSLSAKIQGQLLRKARIQHKLGLLAQELKLREREAQLKDLKLRRRRAWIITMVALLVSMLLAGTAFYRIKQNRLTVKAVLLEQQLLRSKANPHFIFNVFNSIQSYLFANRAKEGQHYLRKFAQLMRVYFEFTELKEVSLKEELKEVSLYVEVEKMRLQTPLEYLVEIEDGIDLDNLLVPPFLLHTYVENSIWHGFVAPQEKAKITVRIEQVKALLQITVSDNGIGINESLRRKMEGDSHNSEGLELNKRRLMGMVQKNSASVEVKDLSQQSTTTSGTQVKIKIPIE